MDLVVFDTGYRRWCLIRRCCQQWISLQHDSQKAVLAEQIPDSVGYKSKVDPLWMHTANDAILVLKPHRHRFFSKEKVCSDGRSKINAVVNDL